MSFDNLLILIVAPSLLGTALYLAMTSGFHVRLGNSLKRNMGLERKLTESKAQYTALATRLNDTQAALEALKTQLKGLESRLSHIGPNLISKLQKQDQDELHALLRLLDAQTPTKAMAYAEAASEAKQKVESFKVFCADPRNVEDKCTAKLAENLWLFLPDLVSQGPMIVNRNIETIAVLLFPEMKTSPASAYKFLDTSRKPDGTGVFLRKSSGSKVLVVIEAKKSRPVSHYVMDEVLNYALMLRKHLPDLANWDIECFAISANIEPEINRQTYSFAGSTGSIVVTPTTWSQLADRAQSLDPFAIKTFAANVPTVETNRVEDDAVASSPSWDIKEALEELGDVEVQPG